MCSFTTFTVDVQDLEVHNLTDFAMTKSPVSVKLLKENCRTKAFDGVGHLPPPGPEVAKHWSPPAAPIGSRWVSLLARRHDFSPPLLPSKGKRLSFLVRRLVPPHPLSP